MFENGKTEVRSGIGIMGFQTSKILASLWNQDYGSKQFPKLD